ncbi:hypothetical protein GKC44_14355, partial [Lactobacillus parabuchneri]|nr:hypothetical protein [Lentilactobacillus parabuchneri]
MMELYKESPKKIVVNDRHGHELIIKPGMIANYNNYFQVTIEYINGDIYSSE